MKRIRIANPRLGGAKEISVRRAEEFVARGIAAWLPDGRIQFVDQVRLRYQAAEMRQNLREERREFERNRRGIVFWNGSKDPTLMHRPGEVVS